MSDVAQLIEAALKDRRGWLVGGALRDEALGRASADFDVTLADDPEAAARALARQARRAGTPAACFPLSHEFGAWRVAARDGRWQVDLQPLQGDSLQADLKARDFTVNAIARDLSDGSLVDPLGGLQDVKARRLRMASDQAFADDPLRVLRLVRIAVELGLEPEADTLARAREHAPRLTEVSPERVFMELQRTLATPRARAGMEMLEEIGAMGIVLPELHALAGVQQSKYHHLDVHGHTLEVLDRLIALQEDPAALFGAQLGDGVASVMAEPLADGLTRGDALRWGALLHDAAKPSTRGVRPGDGRVTFVGHDALGAELAGAVLGRLRTSARLREHVAALVRRHLDLGFLVHRPRPLAREVVFDYLSTTGAVAVDVTLLSAADRLATRGEKSQESIEAHLDVAREMLPEALRWRMQGPPPPLVRGDELAHELGLPPGPRLGELLAELAKAQFAGRIVTREQALVRARELLADARP
jgi:putative nucleotidyltransferase with HDIG domain